MKSTTNMTRYITPLLPRGRFAKNVSIIAGGTALAQTLAIITSPLLTRIYQPADFGVLQIFISLMSLMMVVASGRYETAILLPEEEQSAVDVLALCVMCVCCTALICTGVIVVCHFRWILPSSVLVLRNLLWLLPLSVFGGGIYQLLTYWAMRRGDYRQIATT